MKQGGLDPRMAVALRVGIFAVFVIFLALLLKRVALGRAEAELEELRALAEERE